MTHMPLQHMRKNCVNVHGHTRDAAPTHTRHVNVSVGQYGAAVVSVEAGGGTSRAI